MDDQTTRPYSAITPAHVHLRDVAASRETSFSSQPVPSQKRRDGTSTCHREPGSLRGLPAVDSSSPPVLPTVREAPGDRPPLSQPRTLPQLQSGTGSRYSAYRRSDHSRLPARGPTARPAHATCTHGDRIEFDVRHHAIGIQLRRAEDLECRSDKCVRCRDSVRLSKAAMPRRPTASIVGSVQNRQIIHGEAGPMKHFNGNSRSDSRRGFSTTGPG